jgi:hypothetical protein
MRAEEERRVVVDFSQHVKRAVAGITKAPLKKKARRVAYQVYENTILPTIEHITQRGKSVNTNLQTRYNALEALRAIAETICNNSDDTMGCEIASIFENDNSIEEAMLDILGLLRLKKELGSVIKMWRE